MTRDKFKENEASLEQQRPRDTGDEGSVSRSIQKLLDAAKDLDKHLRSVLDIKATVGSEGEIDEVDNQSKV